MVNKKIEQAKKLLFEWCGVNIMPGYAKAVAIARTNNLMKETYNQGIEDSKKAIDRALNGEHDLVNGGNVIHLKDKLNEIKK